MIHIDASEKIGIVENEKLEMMRLAAQFKAFQFGDIGNAKKRKPST